MPSTIPRAFSAATSRKGLMLAQRRRTHMIELYRSGRWKRYFDEQDLLGRIRDATHDVERWTAAVALWDDPAPVGTPAERPAGLVVPAEVLPPEISPAEIAAQPARPERGVPAGVLREAARHSDRSAEAFAAAP